MAHTYQLSAPVAHGAPTDEDVLSIAASAMRFGDLGGESPSHASGSLTHSSAHSSLQGPAGTQMGAMLRGALARLQLDVPLESPAPTSEFFRRQPTQAALSIRPSEDYIRELHACRRNSKAYSHPTSDARALAAM